MTGQTQKNSAPTSFKGFRKPWREFSQRATVNPLRSADRVVSMSSSSSTRLTGSSDSPSAARYTRARPGASESLKVMPTHWQRVTPCTRARIASSTCSNSADPSRSLSISPRVSSAWSCSYKLPAQ